MPMATGRSKPGPETQPLLLDIRRREIDGGPARENFEPGIGQRRADAVARFLHRSANHPLNSWRISLLPAGDHRRTAGIPTRPFRSGNAFSAQLFKNRAFARHFR